MNTIVDLALKTHKQEGDLAHEYNPLRNMLSVDNQVVEFDTDELSIDLNNPLNIECQPSYDGTVNLIINDDKNPPRIINTRFSKIEDHRYKVINRNQKEQTNLYKVGKIDQQTRLFRNINSIPKIDLIDISNIGQLMGGNYTFYIKFADNDFNKTDIVAESGQVTVYKGYSTKISSISGTIFNERTDKAITLKISDIDTSFSKIYVYYTRETCDENGIRITKAGMYKQPYEIKDVIENITINGFEEEDELTPEEINIQYNIVTAAKTQAQVQNMLFFGNVQNTILNVKDLQNISYYIQVSLKQSNGSIGYINTEDYSSKLGDDVDQIEYYSPNNIYYKLGYWPDELYRLGVVYIMNDDSLTPVFNLRGCSFSEINSYNFKYYNQSDQNNNIRTQLNSLYVNDDKEEFNYLERNEFLTNSNFLDNTFGVFKNANISVIKNDSVKPLYYEMTIPNEIKEALHELHVKGFFFVRQKRIPTNLCQGIPLGIEQVSHVPMPYVDGEHYISESFLTDGYTLTSNFESHLLKTQNKLCSGLFCLDAMVNTTLQSNFDGSEFVLKPDKKITTTRNKRHIFTSSSNHSPSNGQLQATITYVNSDTPMKYINGLGFSTKCGIAEDVSKFSYFGNIERAKPTKNILRGVFCPILATNTTLEDDVVYTIKVPNYSGAFVKDYFKIRSKDNSPFYSISHRYQLDKIDSTIDCYRGDCYTNTVTIRINRNFVDSEVPVSDVIIDPYTWRDNYKGYNKMKDGGEDLEEDKKDKDYGYFSDINRADVNTVPLGMWITYKCLSNYNLGLRTIDTSYVDEYALMGSPRSFYPVNDMSVVSASKVDESRLLNDGYNTTVGHKRNFIVDDVPYIKELFDNRIMFSNVQREDNFQNAYRIFQGLSFKDIDRQYGAIVKLLSYGNNLFCVFEHGLGIIPINEKALISTNTGQSIHMYGAGVIQNQITLITSDFGSIWQESVIRTPVGIYGVDTYAKKIWRYSDKGLETISDMKVQRFLNDNIKLAEKDKYPIVGYKNVKTHYNNYKGDVMFTFYNENIAKSWNLCYNERMNKWITRYSWTPLYSENINNVFYSLDQHRTKVLSHIYNNKYCTCGLRSTNNEWNITDTLSEFNTNLYVVGYSLPNDYTYEIISLDTDYLDSNDKECQIHITNQLILNNLFTINDSTLYWNYSTVNNFFDSNYHIDIPTYFIIKLKIIMNIGSTNYGDASTYFYDSLGIVIDNHVLELENESRYNKQKSYFSRNGFYVHGKAGIFNEIDYRDNTFDNEILPTKWYDRQEPFEFEFVVNDEVGLHKIFDNLVIISNNVQPNQIEYEIIGDVYKFNKTGIFRHDTFGEGEWDNTYNKPKLLTGNEKRIAVKPIKYQSSQEFDNCRVIWDDVLNQYSLITTQDCKNIEEYGRRLGNIQYKEDSWYITIEPIKYYEKYKIEGRSVDESTKTLAGGKYMKKKEARIRDKFVKIRVKYTGEDMVIITALKTILTPSYS